MAAANLASCDAPQHGGAGRYVRQSPSRVVDPLIGALGRQRFPRLSVGVLGLNAQDITTSSLEF